MEKKDEKTSIQKFENISEQVLSRIEQFQKDGSMILPKNYSVENHMKSAWLALQEVEDKEHHKALQMCTKESIANSLLDMVLQGLSVSKNQGYFIVYENKLVFKRSYFGTIALAKRAGRMVSDPVANVIYEGDDFQYEIDPKTAKVAIIKHSQKLENIDNSKIKGAYALVTLADGTTQVTIMSMQQIRAAWGQGATKGNSPAHKNFAEEMAKKTVIGRACKVIINSSGDAWLYDGKEDDADSDKASIQRDAAQHSDVQIIDTTAVEFDDVSETSSSTDASQAQEPASEEAPY